MATLRNDWMYRERMYFNVKQKFVFDLYDYIYIWKMNGIFLIKFKFDFLSIFNRETEIKNWIDGCL